MRILKKAIVCPAILAAIIATLMAPAMSFAQDKTPSIGERPDHPQKDDSAKELNDKLAKYLTGTKWNGNFTMTGKEGMIKETYEIISADKSEVGDYWNLIARIKYGGKDATFPLPPIEIKFAGKTPVITVDRVSFPGFGMYDARVVIRQGKYAGTWSHSGGAGGHLFGTIEKMSADELKEKSESKKEGD